MAWTCPYCNHALPGINPIFVAKCPFCKKMISVPAAERTNPRQETYQQRARADEQSKKSSFKEASSSSSAKAPKVFGTPFDVSAHRNLLACVAAFVDPPPYASDREIISLFAQRIRIFRSGFVKWMQAFQDARAQWQQTHGGCDPECVETCVERCLALAVNGQFVKRKLVEAIIAAPPLHALTLFVKIVSEMPAEDASGGNDTLAPDVIFVCALAEATSREELRRHYSP